MSRATIIVKQRGDRTIITLKKPTKEINILPSVSTKRISQDMFGKVYLTLRFKKFVQLDDYPRKEK